MLLSATAFVVSFGIPKSYSQQVFGSIFGTVTDPAGSIVTNAKVTITDVNKGTKFEVATDSSGNYTKRQLIPDTYTVVIEAPGFSKVASGNMEVHVDEAARYDAIMRVGD